MYRFNIILREIVGKRTKKIVMKVEDGSDVPIKCSGYVNDAKCVIKESIIDMK